MSQDFIVNGDRPIVPGADVVVPAIVASAGPRASRRFLEFFAVTIENPNTHAAYFHACRRFFAWCCRFRFQHGTG
jgi:hypothetical protein